MAGRVLDYVTLGILLVAATFAVLALNFEWAKAAQDGQEAGYKPLGGTGSFGTAEIGFSYGQDFFDDADGIGMVRSGGVLFLIGTIMLGLAALVSEHRVLLGRTWLTTATAIATALSFVLLVIGIILLPIGISEMSDDATFGDGGADLRWTFGLYAGIVAGAGALAASVTAAVSTFRHAGFRLEVADAAGRADFD